MTLYAIRPDPATGALDDAEVVNQSKHGWDFLKQTIALWQLIDAARADEIETIIDRVVQAAGDEEVRIGTNDLRELVRLISGVEEALIVAGIVDEHWRVPPERLEELAARVPAMDLETERSLKSKTSALGEVMSNAISIRNFLNNAVNAGCIVVRA